tara:strand:+ start:12516 stop:13421 length:906 start_codon:yes stop_codon:yes gene_type:complete
MKEYTDKEIKSGFTYRWNPRDDGGLCLKITKSSMGTFLFCPAAYNYSYREQIRGAVSDAMIKGTKVHDAEETFWDNFDIKKAVDIVESSVNPVVQRNKLIEYARETYPTTDHEGAEEIISSMATFYAQEFMESYDNEEIDYFKPVGNEIMLDADLEFEGVELHLQGIIDRVFMSEEGHYILMELKTGPWKDSKRTFMRKEMAFYKVLFEQATDEQKIKFGLDPEIPIKQWGWYFPASNYMYIEKCLTRSTTGVWSSIRNLITSYYQDNFEFKWFYKKCIHCNHVEICEASSKQENDHYDWF